MKLDSNTLCCPLLLCFVVTTESVTEESPLCHQSEIKLQKFQRKYLVTFSSWNQSEWKSTDCLCSINKSINTESADELLLIPPQIIWISSVISSLKFFKADAQSFCLKWTENWIQLRLWSVTKIIMKHRHSPHDQFYLWSMRSITNSPDQSADRSPPHCF